MRIFAAMILTLIVLAISGAGGILYAFYYYGKGLPEYKQLANYNPPVVSRIHAGDGRLMAEFAKEKRVFVPINAMPKRLIKAFISSEDKTFYSHPGVDIPGIVKAVFTNLRRIHSNRRPIGASTITQQVAKNFLLTNEVSIARKAKEVILALRIERAFSKDKILELYLNEIYLGAGSYGVAAAALNYFDKSLDDLTFGEAAYLAGLPKAPNNYHPVRQPRAAKARRDYVLFRMAEDGFISLKTAAVESAKPVVVRTPTAADEARADYFVEEVRRELMGRYGERGLYGGGLSVRTTLDTGLQKLADRALRKGLSEYDRRHGWRGPMGRVELGRGWRESIRRYALPEDVTEWATAMVVEITARRAKILFSDDSFGFIPISHMRWAREYKKEGIKGKPIRKVSDVLQKGDVIAVEPLSTKALKPLSKHTNYALRQIPEVSGGIVAIDPHTGRVLAMSSGFSAELSEFNRVTQAYRQPGSAFKPFVYLAALDRGFTPVSRVLDAPFVIDQGPGLGRWRPANYTKKFYGPSRLRIGLEKSRNLMTVRLAQHIGTEVIVEYAKRFNISKNLPPLLSSSLGAGETSLIKLTTAYAMLVNGGKRIRPTLIDKIQDRNGRTIFKHDPRICEECEGVGPDAARIPVLPDTREQISNPKTTYQIVSMLQGVVLRGTGQRIRTIGKPLAGKTGTTNQSRDAWFVGFSPNLAVGIYIGFDMPRSLGRRETGSSVAAPVFKYFMEKALEKTPAVPFRVPPGLNLVRIDIKTGRPARSRAKSVILEAFLPGTVPTSKGQILDGSEGESMFQRDSIPEIRLRNLY